MPIPALELSGILPPYVGSATDRAAMSPYATTLVEIAQRFCLTEPRKEILRGLLQYRQGLRALGFAQGTQWLSGSFFEDIETLEQRAPQDVDVVTIVRRPPSRIDQGLFQAMIRANQGLFDHDAAKAAFKVDAYFIDLHSIPEHIVDLSRYWFGLFSHRRNGLWKGLVRIPLDVAADDAGAAQLVAP